MPHKPVKVIPAAYPGTPRPDKTTRKPQDFHKDFSSLHLLLWVRSLAEREGGAMRLQKLYGVWQTDRLRPAKRGRRKATLSKNY
jgi:hypothetical protein